MSEVPTAPTGRPDLGKIAETIKNKAQRALGAQPRSDLYVDERKNLENVRRDMENRRFADEIARDKDVHSLRLYAFGALFLLIVVWLGVVLWYISLAARYSQVPVTQADGAPIVPTPFTFKLSDTVMVSFITSTTVSVIGIFLIAARWLFPTTGGDKPGGKTTLPKPTPRNAKSGGATTDQD